MFLIPDSMNFFSFSNCQNLSMKMITLTFGFGIILRQSTQICVLILSGSKLRYHVKPNRIVKLCQVIIIIFSVYLFDYKFRINFIHILFRTFVILLWVCQGLLHSLINWDGWRPPFSSDTANPKYFAHIKKVRYKKK